ncbi:MAG: hypothetical protein ACOH1T_01880 [Microbacteriaceae bacterium]
MNHALRPAVSLVALAAASVLLAGCSLLGLGELERGDDGQVTASSEVNSSELLTGDCFSYLDDGNLARVTIAPCVAKHTHKVLDQGTLTAEAVDTAGGLQNAVSDGCADAYGAFKEGLAEGLKTKQEFLVSKRTVDKVEVQAYSCVALDPTAEPTTDGTPSGEPTPKG